MRPNESDKALVFQAAVQVVGPKHVEHLADQLEPAVAAERKRLAGPHIERAGTCSYRSETRRSVEVRSPRARR